MKKLTGIVTWFNDSKGYGFIETPERLTGDGQKQPIFVHYTSIVGDGFKTLVENQEVKFNLLDGPKGPQAMEVEKGEL